LSIVKSDLQALNRFQGKLLVAHGFEMAEFTSKGNSPM
jgi:hypothetical protein